MTSDLANWAWKDNVIEIRAWRGIEIRHVCWGKEQGDDIRPCRGAGETWHLQGSTKDDDRDQTSLRYSILIGHCWVGGERKFNGKHSHFGESNTNEKTCFRILFLISKYSINIIINMYVMRCRNFHITHIIPSVLRFFSFFPSFLYPFVWAVCVVCTWAGSWVLCTLCV